MAQANISVLLDGLRGKAGSVVFVNTKDGVVIRPRVTPANPRSAAQVAVRSNLGIAASLYKNMTADQATQWHNYGSVQISRNIETGKARALSGITAFTQLASKFLQFSPAGTVPMTPPAESFTGDVITLTASVRDTGLIFTASGANDETVTTELLLQRLPSQNRTPTTKGYRTKAFMAFAAGSLTKSFVVTPGWYIPAYRFVDTETGQATMLTALAPIQMP